MKWEGSDHEKSENFFLRINLEKELKDSFTYYLQNICTYYDILKKSKYNTQDIKK